MHPPPVANSFTPASLSRCSGQAGIGEQEDKERILPASQSQMPTDFKQMTFFFDQIDQVTLTKYSTFILKFGGTIASSLDAPQRVTHIVSSRHHSQSSSNSEPIQAAVAVAARKCILRPRKPSWSPEQAPSAAQPLQTEVASGSVLGGATNTSGSIANHAASRSNNNVSYHQQQLQTANLYTPITSNNNSIPSCFFPSHILPKKNACSINSTTNENSLNNCTSTNNLPKTASALCQFAKERGIVLWGKDELRACLLAELKRYENAQAALKVSHSNGKRLAEYLAEERKIGINAAGASASIGNVANAAFAMAGQQHHHQQHYAASINRNAITNLAFYANSNTHAAKHKRACFDHFIAPGTAAATAATPSHQLAASAKQCFSQLAQPAQQQHIQVFSSQSLNSTYYTFRHPFVLIEDAKQEHKPIFKEYQPALEESSSQSSLAANAVANPAQQSVKQPLIACAMPKLNLNSPAFCCPFVPVAAGSSSVLSQQQISQSAHAKQQTKKQRPSSLKSIIEQRCKRRKAKNAKGKPKAGYCECCFEVYTDMQKHSQTAFHRSFATCEKNYAEIDVVVRSLERPLCFKAPNSPKSPLMFADDKQQQQQHQAEQMERCLAKPKDSWQSDLLRSPCFRKSLRTVPEATVVALSERLSQLEGEDFEASEGDGLMEFLTLSQPQPQQQSAETKQVQQVLNGGMELVGKISNLLQVITDNADRIENDLTVHEILYKK